MPSLVTLRSTENSKLGRDCRWVRSHRRHDATLFAVGKFVQTHRDRQLVANSVHTADVTQLDS